MTAVATIEQPVRLVRSRKRGARLVSPNGLPVVCVTRPGKWGNPFHNNTPFGAYLDDLAGGMVPLGVADDRQLVAAFRQWLEGDAFEDDRDLEPIRRRMLDSLDELRGKNLACWCDEYTCCHADVLLELANAVAGGVAAVAPAPGEGTST